MEQARHALFNAVILALLSAGLMAFRIAAWGEAWNDRSIMLVIIALLGGFGAAFFTRFCLWLAQRLPGIRRMRQRLLVLLLFPPCYLGSMALLLEVQNRLILGKFDDEMTYSARIWVFNLMVRFAFYLAFLPNYLLPFGLPIMTGVAMVLMTRRHSTKT